MRSTRSLLIKELENSHPSIVTISTFVLDDAYEAAASDIHLDPGSDCIQVRLRVDGLLTKAYELPSVLQAELISRLKILSGLRTDERFAPQDGRFKFPTKSGPIIDVRLSIAPTYYGENAVLRLLIPETEEACLESLGIEASGVEQITKTLTRSHGMILVTGPTGSGKTTTLYTLMRMLRSKPISLVSIEDPIEYSIAGVNQIQVNPRNGLTFSQGLRSILRQDPDVLMIGEIRDRETASLAVNAALTGHLVLATLHTNDAVGALPRLLDMNIEPYLIASTVRLIIAERLVRRICKACIYEVTDDELHEKEVVTELSNKESLPTKAYRGLGCSKCNGTGYKGRVGIFEILIVSKLIQEAVSNHSSAIDMRSLAIESGMQSLEKGGLLKVSGGETTIEELLRLRHE